MKKRTYFMDIRLTSGDFVTVVYESSHRKNTAPHQWDLFDLIKANGIDIDWSYKYNYKPETFAYILNRKNADEQCYGEYKVIELQ